MVSQLDNREILRSLLLQQYLFFSKFMLHRVLLFIWNFSV